MPSKDELIKRQNMQLDIRKADNINKIINGIIESIYKIIDTKNSTKYTPAIYSDSDDNLYNIISEGDNINNINIKIIDKDTLNIIINKLKKEFKDCNISVVEEPFKNNIIQRITIDWS